MLPTASAGCHVAGSRENAGAPVTETTRKEPPLRTRGCRELRSPRYLHPLGSGVPLGRAYLQPGVQALLQERPGLRCPAAFSHGSDSRGEPLASGRAPRRVCPLRAGKAAPGAGRSLCQARGGASAGLSWGSEVPAVFKDYARTFLPTCLAGLNVYF